MPFEAKPWLSLGFIVVLLVAFLASQVIKSDAKQNEKRIDRRGIIGVWDDKAGLSTTAIERDGDIYKLIWISNGGFRAEFPLFRDGDWLKKKDPLGIAYKISGDSLDIYDNTGFVRSVDTLLDY